MSAKPRVSIVMGSDSDLDVMRESAKALDEFGIEYEIDVTSAHRSPERTAEYARKAAARGIRVIIAGAGRAHFAPRDWGADSVHVVAGHGFFAGDSADARRHPGGDRGHRQTRRDECGDSRGADPGAFERTAGPEAGSA